MSTSHATLLAMADRSGQGAAAMGMGGVGEALHNNSGGGGGGKRKGSMGDAQDTGGKKAKAGEPAGFPGMAPQNLAVLSEVAELDQHNAAAAQAQAFNVLGDARGTGLPPGYATLYPMHHPHAAAMPYGSQFAPFGAAAPGSLFLHHQHADPRLAAAEARLAAAEARLAAAAAADPRFLGAPGPAGFPAPAPGALGLYPYGMGAPGTMPGQPQPMGMMPGSGVHPPNAGANAGAPAESSSPAGNPNAASMVI